MDSCQRMPLFYRKQAMKTTTGNAIPESGFSLIEVLIALFVLAVGMTGAIAMQLTALRTAQQTQLRTQALYLASEMADSLRSRQIQMLLVDRNTSPLQSDADGTLRLPSAPTENCYRIDSPCDAEQLAQFNLDEWLLRLQQALPDGRARICRDAIIWNKEAEKINWPCDGSAPDAPLVVKVAWRNKAETDAPGAKTNTEKDRAMSVIAFIVSSDFR
jgi:type IV pilus assembly protein PilV